MTPLELTDGVVLLTTPTSADTLRITELCQDTEVQRWTRMPSPYHRFDAQWFVDEAVAPGWADGRLGTWGIRDPTSRRLQGMVSVQLTGAGEIGFWMGASHRGRGWATRACRLAVEAAFDRGVDHVRWMAIVGNDASRRVAQNIGVRVDGQVRRLVEQRGTWHDAWIGTLLPDEVR